MKGSLPAIVLHVDLWALGEQEVQDLDRNLAVLAEVGEEKRRVQRRGPVALAVNVRLRVVKGGGWGAGAVVGRGGAGL